MYVCIFTVQGLNPCRDKTFPFSSEHPYWLWSQWSFFPGIQQMECEVNPSLSPGAEFKNE